MSEVRINYDAQRHVTQPSMQIYVRLDAETSAQLGRIERMLHQLIEGEHRMALDLTQLTNDVSADTDAVNAATTLLSQLAAEITANANDPVALAALAADLEANTANLSAAVTANTPAAPAEPAPEAPPAE